MKEGINGVSFLAGVVIVVLTLFATSANLPDGKLVRVAGIPSPSQIIRINGGVPSLPILCTVPSGERFVVTALGSPSTNKDPSMRVDGSQVLGASLGAGSGPSVVPIPPHYIVDSGAVIQVSDLGFVLGYLVDE